MKTPIPGSPHPILKPPRLLINTSTPKSKGGKPGTLNPRKIILESGSKETQMEIPPPTPISKKRGRPTSPSSPEPTPSKRLHPLPSPSLGDISPITMPDLENEGTINLLNTYIRGPNANIVVGIEGRAPTLKEQALLKEAMAKLLGSANIIKTSTPKPKRELTITIPKNMVKRAQTLTQLPTRPNSIVTVVEWAQDPQNRSQ